MEKIYSYIASCMLYKPTVYTVPRVYNRLNHNCKLQLRLHKCIGIYYRFCIGRGRGRGRGKGKSQVILIVVTAECLHDGSSM